MKRNKVIAMILGIAFIVAFLTSCDCGCKSDEKIELRPIKTTEYKLYISDYSYRTIYVYMYDLGGENLKMYKGDNGPMNIVFESKEPQTHVEDTESVLEHKGTYFDY